MNDLGSAELGSGVSEGPNLVNMPMKERKVDPLSEQKTRRGQNARRVSKLEVHL